MTGVLVLVSAVASVAAIAVASSTGVVGAARAAEATTVVVGTVPGHPEILTATVVSDQEIERVTADLDGRPLFYWTVPMHRVSSTQWRTEPLLGLPRRGMGVFVSAYPATGSPFTGRMSPWDYQRTPHVKEVTLPSGAVDPDAPVVTATGKILIWDPRFGEYLGISFGRVVLELSRTPDDPPEVSRTAYQQLDGTFRVSAVPTWPVAGTTVTARLRWDRYDDQLFTELQRPAFDDDGIAQVTISVPAG